MQALLNQAAIKIQKIFRGYLIRKEVLGKKVNYLNT